METQSIEKEELKKVAGGNIFEDFVCAIAGHDPKWDTTAYRTDPSGVKINYLKYKCAMCGEAFYSKINLSTGEETKISRKEFESILKNKD